MCSISLKKKTRPFTIKNRRLYSQHTSSFCCFLVQLAGHEVVENEGRGARARAWSGAHGDRAWSADVGVAAWGCCAKGELRVFETLKIWPYRAVVKFWACKPNLFDGLFNFCV